MESFGGRLPVSRRSGYLSRSSSPSRSGGDGDGESIGGRRSSSGIRCPAASYAVVSARFKEPREPFVSSADERRPPRVVFSQTLRLFEETPNVVNVASLAGAAAAARSTVFAGEDEREKHSWRWITRFVRR